MKSYVEKLCLIFILFSPYSPTFSHEVGVSSNCELIFFCRKMNKKSENCAPCILLTAIIVVVTPSATNGTHEGGAGGVRVVERGELIGDQLTTCIQLAVWLIQMLRY